MEGVQSRPELNHHKTHRRIWSCCQSCGAPRSSQRPVLEVPPHSRGRTHAHSQWPASLRSKGDGSGAASTSWARRFRAYHRLRSPPGSAGGRSQTTRKGERQLGGVPDEYLLPLHRRVQAGLPEADHLLSRCREEAS